MKWSPFLQRELFYPLQIYSSLLSSSHFLVVPLHLCCSLTLVLLSWMDPVTPLFLYFYFYLNDPTRLFFLLYPRNIQDLHFFCLLKLHFHLSIGKIRQILLEWCSSHQHLQIFNSYEIKSLTIFLFQDLILRYLFIFAILLLSSKYPQWNISSFPPSIAQYWVSFSNKAPKFNVYQAPSRQPPPKTWFSSAKMEYQAAFLFIQYNQRKD